MEAKLSEQGGVTVIVVQGEININTSPELKKMFEKQPVKKVLVNLEKVTYVDSSGLATLVDMLKKTKSQGGTFCLAGMPDKIKSLFEITKLDKLFSIFPSQEDALTRIK